MIVLRVRSACLRVCSLATMFVKISRQGHPPESYRCNDSSLVQENFAGKGSRVGGCARLQFVVSLHKSCQCHYVNATKHRFGRQLCQICVIASISYYEWRLGMS